MSPFYLLGRAPLLVFFDQVVRVDLVSRFPRVVVIGISLPLDQILEAFGAPISPVTFNTFHFEFFFPVDKVW